MTMAAYQAMGGLSGALVSRAEAIHAAQDDVRSARPCAGCSAGWSPQAKARRTRGDEHGAAS